jgi:hypothetical protein
MAAALFRLPRTRHPLLRVLSVVLGLVVLGATLLFGIFIVLGLAAIGAAVWAARQFAKPRAAATANPPPAAAAPRATPPGVIEGEFVVVREPVSPRR